MPFVAAFARTRTRRPDSCEFGYTNRMTYLLFHGIFILPPLLMLAWFARTRITRAHGIVIAGVCFIALAFTMPWDHFAVAKKIWEFNDARVMARVWLLPVEEILFFILETVGVCLLTILFLPKATPS